MFLLFSAALASPASFTRDFAAALERAFPECRAEPVARLTLGVRCEAGNELVLSLARVHGLCKTTPASCGAEREAFLRGVDEVLHPKPPTIGSIVPGIRPRSVLQGPQGEKVLFEPWVGDLVVVYLVDSPTTMRYLNRTELGELGVSAEGMFAATRGNVKTAAGELEVSQHGPLLWLTGSVYTSSMLLEDTFWARLAEQHAVVYAAVPARDVVLVLGTDASDTKAPELLRLAAEAIVLDPATSGALSAEVLRWAGGSWESVGAGGKPRR